MANLNVTKSVMAQGEWESCCGSCSSFSWRQIFNLKSLHLLNLTCVMRKDQITSQCQPYSTSNIDTSCHFLQTPQPQNSNSNIFNWKIKRHSYEVNSRRSEHDCHSITIYYIYMGDGSYERKQLRKRIARWIHRHSLVSSEIHCNYNNFI